MKTLKLLILSLLFVAGQQAFGQQVTTNNAFPSFTFNITYNTPPCGAPFYSLAPNSSVTFTICSGGSLTSIDVSFTDNTCSPPALVNINIPTTTIPTIYTYTLCDGQQVNFHINLVGSDILIDITP